MEGINSLCLSAILCGAAIFVAAATYFPLSTGIKHLLATRFGGKHAHRSGMIAGLLTVIIACVVFYLISAPTFSNYYQPVWPPNESDVVGIWTPTRGAYYDMKKAGYEISDPSVELRENGEFIMTNLPDNLFTKTKGELYSGVGVWSLKKDFQNYWHVEVVLSSQTPPYYRNPPYSIAVLCPGKSVPCAGYGFTFDMSNRQPPYSFALHQPGDGELGSSFTFHRVGDSYQQP